MGLKKEITLLAEVAPWYWLSMHYRLKYNMALFVVKALNGLVPGYVGAGA